MWLGLLEFSEFGSVSQLRVDVRGREDCGVAYSFETFELRCETKALCSGAGGR